MTVRTGCCGLVWAVFVLLQAGAGCVEAETMRPQKNLAVNGSFEQVEEGLPAGWSWRPDRAQATLLVDEEVSRSGERSVRIANQTGPSPHVYSRLHKTLRLDPGETYTLSCYVRSEEPGTAWIGGGHGWRIRLALPATGQEWQRVQTTFTALAEERSFELMILTESPTPGLWVDDVQLEVGEQATDFDAEEPLGPGEAQLRLRPVKLQPNLLPNASFEDVDGNRPRHWLWDQRNTDATMTVDTEVARTGRNSLRFTNNTPFGAHVYGILTLVGGASVKPETTYTFSCYVRGGTLGVAWFGGGTGWRTRALFPRRLDEGWHRVVRSFTTTADETNIPVILVTETPTEPFWVDDVQLVEGPEPMPWLPEDDGRNAALEMAFARDLTVMYRGTSFIPAWNQTRFPRDRYTFSGRELWADGTLYLPHGLHDARLEARLTGADGTVLAEQIREGNLEAGTYLVSFGWGAGTAPGGQVTLQTRLAGARADTGQAVELADTLDRRVVTAGDVEAILREVEADLGTLQRHAGFLRAQSLDPAYLLVTVTVLQNSTVYARDDLAHGETARAYDAALEMQEMVSRALERTHLPDVPRFKAPAEGRPVRIDGPALLGNVVWPDGREEQGRPVQMVGHGHFGQVRQDVVKFPGYGVNLIQIEFGPNSVLPSEDAVSTAAVDQFLEVADRAAEAGVAIDLLLSPHYFPAWALDKWPHLKDCTGGFFRYCVHAPEARSVIERSLREVIPRIRHHPALHSLCLSNEPLSIDSVNCHVLPGQWAAWLQERHGTIDRLNERWGTGYAAFDGVPVPPAGFKPEPHIYDFVQFNTEVFADFHAWMAGVIREMAPDIPLHSKIMIGAHFGRHVHGPWSIDPELFAGFSDFNGNDSWKTYRASGDWAAHWQSEIMGYDFQRSVADKPVFNSENHIIPDRHVDTVPPEYIANAYWQGSIHGQSATTTWVWERTFSHTSDFAGSIMHRAACTEALGHIALDLMRLAPEVLALQSLRPQVVLLWSQASLVYGDEHLAALRRLYEGLNFSGLRLGFVTERQLARFAETGEIPLPLREARVVVAPRVTHTPESTLAGLRRFLEQGGRVVQVGDCFARDEYDHPRADEPPGGERLDLLPATPREVHAWAQGRLEGWGIARPVRLVTAESGEPAWGVEYVAAEVDGQWLVNLANYTTAAARVRLLVDGQARAGVDLVSGEELESVFDMPVLRPRLVEVR